MRDLCKGLRILHANGVVHMDLKPTNILYSYSNIFKIADLGMAKLVNQLTKITPSSGRYFAKEVVCDNNDSIPDFTKADMFSLGAILYEIVEGVTLPQKGEEWEEFRNGNFQLNNKFSTEINSIIRQLLDKNPL